MMNFLKKKKTIIFLEMGKTNCRVIVVDQNIRGKFTVSQLIQLDRSQEEHLLKLLDEKRINFDELNIVLTRNQVMVRNLELPSEDPQEIQDIVDIQAAKQTPFSRDEIISDFLALGSGREHYTKVLVCIVDKNVIKKIMDGLAERTSTIGKIYLSSECLESCFPEVRQSVQDESFGIIEFNEDYCDFSIFQGSLLLFSRILQVDTSMLQNEGWKDSFLEEIQCSLKMYQQDQTGPSFSKIVFVGPKTIIDQILESIKKEEAKTEQYGLDQYQFKAIAMSKKHESIMLTEEAQGVLNIREQQGDSFDRLLGLLNAVEKPKMNLLPGEIKTLRENIQKRKESILTVILAFFIVLGMLGIFFEKAFAKAILLSNLESLQTRLEKSTLPLQREQTRVQLIKQRLNMKNSALEILKQVYTVTPQIVYLSAITFDENTQVTLRGTTNSMSEVLEFVKVLEELPMFERVEQEYFSKRELKEKEYIDFEISCPIVE